MWLANTKIKKACFALFLLVAIPTTFVVAEEEEEDEDSSPVDPTAAVPLTVRSFANFLETHDEAFINFDTPWCVWCQRLAPTWEEFAKASPKR